MFFIYSIISTACDTRNSRWGSETRADTSLATAALGQHYQFLRLGYFTVDTDSTPEKLVINRTVTLRDAWAKAK